MNHWQKNSKKIPDYCLFGRYEKVTFLAMALLSAHSPL